MCKPAKIDSQYPYTYACDLIRTRGGHDSGGTKLSRGEASKIRQLFSVVLGMDDEELAKKLADYYIENCDAISEESSRELLSALGIFTPPYQ